MNYHGGDEVKAFGNIEPLQVQVVRDFKGIDHRSLFNIPDNVAYWGYELTTEDYPVIRTRNGMTALGQATTNLKAALGIGGWKNSEINVVFAGTWYKWTGSSWTIVQIGLSATDFCSFCNFKGNLTDINLLMANGVDPVKKYNGTSVSNLANAPSNVKFIDAHDNRVYCAKDNTIYFSALRKPEDWSTLNDAGSIEIESNNGETINGIAAGLEHLLIFKPNAMYELFGTGPSNYRLIQISEEIGIHNHRCSTSLNGVVYFLHRTGFYRYTGGSQPDKSFSQPIQPMIDLMDNSDITLNSVGNDGKHIYVTISKNLWNGYFADNKSNYTYQYNPTYGTWSIYNNDDDRKIKDYEFINGKLYAIANSYVFNFNNGLKTDNLTGQNLTITSIYSTKAFTGGILNSNARYTRLFLTYIASSVGQDIRIYINAENNQGADSGSWQLIKTITSTSQNVVEYSRIVLPNDAFQKNKYIRIQIRAIGYFTLMEYAFEVLGKPLA